MPTYIDIHDAPGLTPEDIAKAHRMDLEIQDRHGVQYHKYWFNQEKGKAFCLCTAPDADSARAVHRESHGMVADRIMEVTPEIADAFMGGAEIDRDGAVLLPGKIDRDPATRTVLFTDIVGSTEMTQRLGDEIAFALLKAHDDIVRAALAANGGREVKHTGDGIMAAFVSAASAVRCGMTIQQDLRKRRAQHADQPLMVRIGVAAGEPIEHHADFFGTTVQLAARLCASAAPEQILVANAVAELCMGKALPLKDAGQIEVKGFDQPVRVFSLEMA